LRLVALNEGPEILIDKPMILVGRHPMCDTRLNSVRVSRRHCCMTLVSGELEVKDLGSTNGIQINGHRVVAGRLRPGDELAIAHLRYKLVIGEGQETTLADPVGLVHSEPFLETAGNFGGEKEKCMRSLSPG
jgi:pSer/pThr/pTyr-binding forkhead associated (FHA) protein